MTNIDYYKLLRWLLPARLRTAGILAWVTALIAPIRNTLYTRFKRFEQKAFFDLKHQTGQVAFLEYVLNERFDISNKSIFISPGFLSDDRQYIYTDSENVALDLYLDIEHSPIYLFTDLEFQLGYGSFDFVINVPGYLAYLESQLRAVADRYKRDGKSYVIQYF